MIIHVTPTGDVADRLSRIDRAAFGPRPGAWTPDDFRTCTGLILADDAVCQGLIVVTCAADQAEVVTLGVVPSARRAGLAAALLLAAEQAAAQAGATDMFLEVAIDNTAACALYASAGYVQTGLRRAYYRRPDTSRVDAAILSKPLAAPTATA